MGPLASNESIAIDLDEAGVRTVVDLRSFADTDGCVAPVIVADLAVVELEATLDAIAKASPGDSLVLVIVIFLRSGTAGCENSVTGTSTSVVREDWQGHQVSNRFQQEIPGGFRLLTTLLLKSGVGRVSGQEELLWVCSCKSGSDGA